MYGERFFHVRKNDAERDQRFLAAVLSDMD